MQKRYDYYQPEFDDDEEYLQGESEQLEEELDPNYEPTKQEIQQYALEILGMAFPEDQPLLYLARQALKAPLPESWSAFQSPSQEVYYKHKVTQQKIFEHPIDIEYKKRYQQEKEKAARKTLKSKVPLKNMSPASGLVSALGPGFGNSLTKSPLSVHSHDTKRGETNAPLLEVQDDPDTTQKDQMQIEQFQANLRKKAEGLRRTQEEEFNNFDRRLRNSHNQEMDRLKREASTVTSLEDKLRSEKARITAQLDRQFEGALKKDALEVSEFLERDFRNLETDTEGSLNKKLFDEEAGLQRKIEAREQQYQGVKDSLRGQRVSLQDKKKSKIEQLRKAMSNSQSAQISRELEDRMRKITAQFELGLKNKTSEFQGEYQKISKLVKGSPEDKIRELLSQKVCLQEISNKKMEMSKIKQKKLIENELQLQLLQEQNKIRKANQSRHLQQISECQRDLEQKSRSATDCKMKELEHKSGQMETGVYEKFRQKIQDFQLKKNKNITSIRQSFIKEIEEKADQMESGSEIQAIRMQAQERRYQVQNKTKQVDNTKRDIGTLDKKLHKVQFNRKIYRAKNSQEITVLLKKSMEQLKIEMRGDQNLDNGYVKQALVQHVQQLKQAKKQLDSDKHLLMKVFQHLQSNTILPSYEKKKAQDSMNYSNKLQSMTFATSQLLKKYNNDVRLMRDNSRAIQELESLIKKVQLDDDHLQQLESFELAYQIPELREQLSNFNIEEVARQTDTQFNLKELSGHTTDLMSTKKVKQMFNDHSKFLSGIKSELNYKLSQIRNMSHYN